MIWQKGVCLDTPFCQNNHTITAANILSVIMCIYRYAPDSKRVERLIIWQKGVSVQIRPFAKLIA